MSARGLNVFGRTLPATNILLDDIQDEMGWSNRAKAYRALWAVLYS